MAIRKQKFLAIASGAGAWAVVLSQACSNGAKTGDGGSDGGAGGDSSGPDATGGRTGSTTGTGGEAKTVTAGQPGDGMGMGGSSQAFCGPDEWFDGETDKCASCASLDPYYFPSSCDVSSDYGGNLTLNELGTELTFRLRPGVPRFVTATYTLRVHCDYVDESDSWDCSYPNEILPVMVEDDTLTISLRRYAKLRDVDYVSGELYVRTDCDYEGSVGGVSVASPPWDMYYSGCEG